MPDYRDHPKEWADSQWPGIIGQYEDGVLQPALVPEVELEVNPRVLTRHDIIRRRWRIVAVGVGAAILATGLVTQVVAFPDQMHLPVPGMSDSPYPTPDPVPDITPPFPTGTG